MRALEKKKAFSPFYFICIGLPAAQAINRAMCDEKPRLMNRADAAAYCGVGTSTFHAWVRNGFLPKPLFGSKRWDRKALDLALDKASGIANDNGVASETPYQKWKREHAGASGGIDTREEDPVERWIRTGK